MDFLELASGESEQLVVIDLANGCNASKGFPVRFWAERPDECDGSWCVEACDQGGESFALRCDGAQERWNKVASGELPTPKKKSSDRLVGDGLSSSAGRGEGRGIADLCARREDPLKRPL